MTKEQTNAFKYSTIFLRATNEKLQEKNGKIPALFQAANAAGVTEGGGDNRAPSLSLKELELCCPLGVLPLPFEERESFLPSIL